MKYCSNCGYEVGEDADVCSNCGYVIHNKPSVSFTPTPVGQLKTNRGLLKFVLLSLITFGIYGLVVMSAVSTDITVIASRYDGKKTMHYCLVFFIFAPLTFGIVYLVWSHRLCERIGCELTRRTISYRFGPLDFWLWGILGSLIIVGPFIYMYRLLKTRILLAEYYNING